MAKPLKCPPPAEAILRGKPVSEAGTPPHGPRVGRLSSPRYQLGSEGELMVRTYWFLPIFYEAIDILDLQPSARSDNVEACRPLGWCPSIVRCAEVRVKELTAPHRVGKA